jgi:hypothetical protein
MRTFSIGPARGGGGANSQRRRAVAGRERERDELRRAISNGEKIAEKINILENYYSPI